MAALNVRAMAKQSGGHGFEAFMVLFTYFSLLSFPSFKKNFMLDFRLTSGRVHDDPHHARAGVLLRQLREQRAHEVLRRTHPEGGQHFQARKVHPHHLRQQGEAQSCIDELSLAQVHTFVRPTGDH